MMSDANHMEAARSEDNDPGCAPPPKPPRAAMIDGLAILIELA